MALGSVGVEFILYARSLGVDFRTSLQIGRQSLAVSPAELRRLMARFDFHCQAPEVAAGDQRFADGLFKCLGAERVDALDVSSEEGATLIHDLNKPLAAELRDRFSLVFDGGSLEHVFDVPNAWASLMQMVALNGHLLMINPVDGAPGHGFYQFSPELYYSVLSKASGFELREILICAMGLSRKWYRVNIAASGWSIPRFQARSRVVYACVIAKRVGLVEPFSTPPVQECYSPRANPASGGGGVLSRMGRIAQGVPPSAQRVLLVGSRLVERHGLRYGEAYSRFRPYPRR